MGFNIKTTELLIESKKLGINLASVCDFRKTDAEWLLCRIFKSFSSDWVFDQDQIREIISRENRYSEPFLKTLGAGEIDTFDASDYEGASQVWDMNLPISEDFKEKYSLMIDSGSLEHIFNFSRRQ